MGTSMRWSRFCSITGVTPSQAARPRSWLDPTPGVVGMGAAPPTGSASLWRAMAWLYSVIDAPTAV